MRFMNLKLKKLTSILLIITAMISLASCSSHKYNVEEIEEKLNVTSLESRQIYCGEDWGKLTYYFTLESEKYKNIYFYLFDSSKEATEYYNDSVKSFDTISEEGDNYTIGEMQGGDVIDRECVFVSDNLVVYINMGSDYYGDMGEHTTTDSYDTESVKSFVEEW